MSTMNAALATGMIQATAHRLAESAPELSRLDAVAGDGDHGVNMEAAFRNAVATLVADRPGTAGEVFRVVGDAFSEGAGGSAGALFGAIFSALGGRLRRSPEPGARDFVEGLELAAERVAVIGQTATGSKTMLDALDPAVTAARSVVESGGGLEDVMAAAAVASERGAAATAGMRASAGRARHAPNGAIGTMDPGAVTVSIMFAAWTEVVAQRVTT
jgi:dihydroxyacetone kinase